MCWLGMGFEEEHSVGLGLGFEEEHDVGLDLGFAKRRRNQLSHVSQVYLGGNGNGKGDGRG